jgi:RimJ/RimL family protein N-acetyltransferase
MNLAKEKVGHGVPGWTPREAPSRTPMVGRFCRVEPLDPERHAADLHAANRLDAEGRNWTYLFQQPFRELQPYRAWLEQVAKADDPLFHAIVDAKTGKAVGVATFMRIDRANGVIEVGNINYSPLLQRTPAATEAMFLMMARVFDELGYRRYEWKCDSLNAPSRAAALRLGFRYEGLFRQAVVYKGRNRDTAWFSIIDSEWPALKRAYRQWLAPENFDGAGRQRRGLAELTGAATIPTAAASAS